MMCHETQVFRWLSLTLSVPLFLFTRRAREEMAKRGIDPESPEAKIFARKLLSALTKTFGRNILETGFFHAGKMSAAWRRLLLGMRCMA